jgi:hypothetical protein
MTLLRASLLGAAAAVVSLAATAASAATAYDFTLTDNDGSTIDASGILIMAGDVIRSIKGSVTNFGTITGLIYNPNSPYAHTQGNIIYDNLFDTTVPGVDNDGIYLKTSLGDQINIFNLDSGGYNVPDSSATEYVDNTGVYAAYGHFSITPDPTAAIPEAGAWAMMLVGMGLAGATLRSHAKGDRTAD